MEQIVETLGLVTGVSKVGAEGTESTFADGYELLSTDGTTQGMFEGLVTILGSSGGTAKIGGAAIGPIPADTLYNQLLDQFNVRTVGTASYTIVQNTRTDNNALVEATFNSPNTAGNLLIACLSCGGLPSGAPPEFEDIGIPGNTWVLANYTHNVSTGYGTMVWYCLNTAAYNSGGKGTTLRFYGASTTMPAVEIIEISATAGTLFNYIQNQGAQLNSSTSLTISVGTAQANDLIFHMVNSGVVQSHSPGDDWEWAGFYPIDYDWLTVGNSRFICGTIGSGVGTTNTSLSFTTGLSVNWVYSTVVAGAIPTLDADGTYNSFVNFTAATPFQLTAASGNQGRRIYLTDSTGAASGSTPIALIPNGSDTINGVNATYNLITSYGRWILQCGANNDWYVFSC
jgi:hypothetical protein